MRLFRFGNPGQELPGVFQVNSLIDVSGFGEDFDERFFESDGIGRLALWLEENVTRCARLDRSVRFGPCIARPSKIICIGLNYARHAAESGAAVPSEPVIFLKSTSALCGPSDNLLIPPNADKVDWEVEMACVIGRKTIRASPENALEYVAGYCVLNDYSERAFQLERGGQWVKGKSCDSFAPIGPFLVTPDEIRDPHDLRLWLKVNGAIMQNSNTSDMIFRIPVLVSYVSQFMTLLPGDVISTGTPAGVGFGLKPPRYLREGDVIEYGIEGLGSGQQTAITSPTV